MQFLSMSTQTSFVTNEMGQACSVSKYLRTRACPKKSALEGQHWGQKLVLSLEKRLQRQPKTLHKNSRKQCSDCTIQPSVWMLSNMQTGSKAGSIEEREMGKEKCTAAIGKKKGKKDIQLQGKSHVIMFYFILKKYINFCLNAFVFVFYKCSSIVI